MRTIFFTQFLAIAIVSSTLSGCSSDSPENNHKPAKEEKLPTLELTSRQSEISTAQHDAQLALFNELACCKLHDLCDEASKKKNVLFSPISINLMMSAYANGLEEKEADKIVKLFGCQNLNELNKFNETLMNYIPQQGNVNKIALCNSVWYDKGVTLSQEFTADITDFYKGTIQQVELQDPATKRVINAWIEEKTSNVIKDYIKEGDIMPDYIMFVNTTYFNCKWKYPFKKERTSKQDFFGFNGVVKVPLMHQQRNFSYVETPEAQMVSLPFVNDRCSMHIIMPSEGVSTVEWLEQATPELYNSLKEKMRVYYVDLKLPKLTEKFKTDLSATLMKHGIDPTVPLPRAGLTDAQVDKMLIQHFVHFSMDEEGAEVAAVTNNMLATSPGPMPDAKMYVNRPFIVIIEEQTTGAIILSAVISDLDDTSASKLLD